MIAVILGLLVGGLLGIGLLIFAHLYVNWIEEE